MGVHVNTAEPLVGAAEPSAAQTPQIVTISRFAAHTLAPHANRIDRRGIRRSHLDELANTGAFGLPFPTEFGGGDAPKPVIREAVETIAGACGTTWFCFAQHRSPTQAVLRSQNFVLREQWAPRLASGRAIAGIAFAHLRRPKQRFWIREDGGSLILRGSLDWVTTWPLADVVLVEGYLQDRDGQQLDEIVSVLIEPPKVDLNQTHLTDREDIQAGPALSLAAMGGTQTWPVSFSDFRVGAESIVSRKPAEQWLAENALVSADANPASFGMARAAINEMAHLGEATGQPRVVEAAHALAAELVPLRERAYAAADAAAASVAAAPGVRAAQAADADASVTTAPGVGAAHADAADAASVAAAPRVRAAHAASVSRSKSDGGSATGYEGGSAPGRAVEPALGGGANAAASIEDRTLLRAAALDLNLRAATATIAASGGASMMLSSNAQRRAREALFLLVQGQTTDLRSATLSHLTP